GLAERGDPDPHPVGPSAAALHEGGDRARGHVYRHHLPLACVASPALEPIAHTDAFEHLDEPLRPPCLGDRAARATRLHPGLDGTSPDWKRSTISSRRALDVPPCRYSTSWPKRAARCGKSISANSVYWVKHRTRSPSARISSRTSSSRITFPDRLPMADRSCNR